MSRIGKLAVEGPSGVTVARDAGGVRVAGPRGRLAARLSPLVEVRVESGSVVVTRRDDSREARAVHGLARKLVANMVTGVSSGFRRVLEINGVGYRAEAKGRGLHPAP